MRNPVAQVGFSGKAFLVVLILVVMEGAARKWISPALTLPLLLMRDGYAIYAISHLLRTREVKLGHHFIVVLMVWTTFVVAWGMCQLMAGKSTIPIYVVGLRFWLLYVWFGLIVGLGLKAPELRKIVKVSLCMIVLFMPLAVWQHLSPPASFINREVGDESSVFLLVPGVVRVTGTFSFTLGFTTLLAFVTPLILCAVLEKERFGIPTWLATIAFVCLVICTGVSGSRGALIFFGAMLLVSMIVAFASFHGRTRGRALKLVFLGALFAGLVVLALPTTLVATQERFETAAKSEDFFQRIETVFMGEPNVYEHLSFMGEGIGMGSNLAAYLKSGERYFALAEAENGRVLLEGGLLGAVFILLKLIVISAGVWTAAKLSLRNRVAMPLVFWVALSVAILSWSWIGQLSAQPLLGLMLALGVAFLRPSLFTRDGAS